MSLTEPTKPKDNSDSAQQDNTQVDPKDDTPPFAFQPPPPWNQWVYIALFSIFGALARIGLEQLFLLDYTVQPVSSGRTAITNIQRSPIYFDFWPNIVGCLLMGFLLKQAFWLRKSIPPLYVGLTTGMCGSLTTFSSWMYEATVKIYQQEYTNYFLVLLIGYATSYLTFLLGVHLSMVLGVFRKGFYPESSAPGKEFQFKLKKRTSHLMDLVICTLFIGTYISTISLVSLYPNELGGLSSLVLWTIIFSPWGALARFYILLYNSHFPKTFPMATFFVNIMGVCIIGALYIVRIALVLTPTSSAIIGGISTGFCGSLTTVSTFMGELDQMKHLHNQYCYALASIIVSQVILLALFGGYYDAKNILFDGLSCVLKDN